MKHFEVVSDLTCQIVEAGAGYIVGRGGLCGVDLRPVVAEQTRTGKSVSGIGHGGCCFNPRDRTLSYAVCSTIISRRRRTVTAYRASKDAAGAAALAKQVHATAKDEAVRDLASAVAQLAKAVEEIAGALHRSAK